jgi:hypothetical protein
MKTLLVSFFLFLFNFSGYCEIRTVVSNLGQGWGNSDNWSPSGIPVDGDKVIIPAGKTISVKGAFYNGIEAIKILVTGTLDFDPSGKLNLGILSSVQLDNSTSYISSNGTASELIQINGQTKYQGSIDGTIVGPKYASSISLASPLGFTVGILPVKLLSFSVRQVNNGVALKWKTAQEINTSRFNIERSNNGKDWHSIAFVNPMGNNSSYSFTDRMPADGDNFYRLKTIDLDGAAEFSTVQKIRAATRSGIIIGPNPVVDHLTIHWSRPQASLRVQLINENGQVVTDEVASDQTTSFRLQRSKLKSGTYFLKLYDKALLYQTMVLIR